MSLLHFFASFRGRISRQEWWLGLLFLLSISVPAGAWLGAEAVNPATGEIKPPSLAYTLWSIVVSVPSAAISAKRFNDRDWPSWLGYLLGAAFIVLALANYFGYLLDPSAMAPLEKTIFAALLLFFLWAIVDNGFLKGTDGPNRHGPDPLHA